MSNADRIRAKFALAHGKTPVGDQCPPLEQIVAWHEKTLDAADATVMQSHVAHCDLCFALWSGMLALEPDPVAAASAAPVSRRRWWQFALPGAAVGAMALTLWLGFLGADPLPAYSLDVRGGMEMRGGDAAPLVVLSEDSLLQIVVAPASRVDEPIEAAGFFQGTGDLQPLPVDVTVSAKGVASVEALVGTDLIVAPGTTRLIFVVGRPGELPSAEALTDTLGAKSSVAGKGWQAFAVDVDQPAN